MTEVGMATGEVWVQENPLGPRWARVLGGPSARRWAGAAGSALSAGRTPAPYQAARSRPAGQPAAAPGRTPCLATGAPPALPAPESGWPWPAAPAGARRALQARCRLVALEPQPRG